MQTASQSPTPSLPGSGSELKGWQDNHLRSLNSTGSLTSHRGLPDILHPHQGDESQAWHLASRNSQAPALSHAPTFRAGHVHSDLADTHGGAQVGGASGAHTLRGSTDTPPTLRSLNATHCPMPPHTHPSQISVPLLPSQSCWYFPSPAPPPSLGTELPALFCPGTGGGRREEGGLTLPGRQ